MAITKRTFDLSMVITGNPAGFVEAYGIRRTEYLEDGVVGAERDNKIPLTLAQVKTIVAAL